MRSLDYTDTEGRKHRVLLPPDAPDEHAPMGIDVGVPSLESLGLPLEIEVRLHNRLHDAGIFNRADTRRRRNAIIGAVLGAISLDVQRVVDLYQDKEH